MAPEPFEVNSVVQINVTGSPQIPMSGSKKSLTEVIRLLGTEKKELHIQNKLNAYM